MSFLQHIGDFSFPRLADFGAAISGANKLQCQQVLEELDVCCIFLIVTDLECLIFILNHFQFRTFIWIEIWKPLLCSIDGIFTSKPWYLMSLHPLFSLLPFIFNACLLSANSGVQTFETYTRVGKERNGNQQNSGT